MNNSNFFICSKSGIEEVNVKLIGDNLDNKMELLKEEDNERIWIFNNEYKNVKLIINRN